MELKNNGPILANKIKIMIRSFLRKSKQVPLVGIRKYFGKTQCFYDNVPEIKPSLPQRLVDASPKEIRPYLQLMRLDKPIGTWLLLLPGLWSISIAQGTFFPDPWLYFLFTAGAILMRGAGCTVNDYLDRDIDHKVERTRSRPITSGLVSKKQAIAFLGAQLAVSMCILLSLNSYSVILGASSLLFVFTYPLFKRFTNWPQLMLGFTFNWGAMLGYSAVKGFCDWGVTIPLYIAGISWTLIYDTIYAHQDKLDDIKVGVKSTALRFGENTRQWLSGFSILFGSMLGLVGTQSGQTESYYIAISIAFLHILYQIWFTNFDNPRDCMKKFVSNRWTGLIILLGILISNYYKSTHKTTKD
jgi:4-hydroxybenzoate polyprenyltransferase